jgi:hypothetical protein
LTDQVLPHNQDGGLFRSAGQADERELASDVQADERELASDVTDVRPMTRPSRNLFHHAGNREAGKHQQPTAQRDEAAMRSLRFPFEEDDCR